MLQLIRSDLNIDFIRWRTPAMVFSGTIMLIGILSLILQGGPELRHRFRRRPALPRFPVPQEG